MVSSTRGRRIWQKCESPCYKYYTGFTRFYRFVFNIFSFQHVFHFDVGGSQMEWNLKLRDEILVCTAIMLNDHGNPCNNYYCGTL